MQNTKDKTAFRVEKDVMGTVQFPANAYFGIFTVRAHENFPISGLRIHPVLNKSIVHIKMAAAESNKLLHLITPEVAREIIGACKKILAGAYNDQFIIDVFSAGAGTPWNMNVNEVIANVALESLGKPRGSYDTIDPHDHVNRGQSSNDVIPCAIRIAALQLYESLVPQLTALITALRSKGTEFINVIKVGRTHLQDAVPITLGQELNAWAHDVQKRLDFLTVASKNLQFLNLGGTAVGTGINTHPRFGMLAVQSLKKALGLPLVLAPDKIEETQFMSDMLDVSAALRTLATDLNKISNDLRLLCSGPTTGLRDITLPQVEPGSSIMPSKFNPSIAEMLNMVCMQVIGNDTVIQHGAEGGQLELNVMTPVIAHNLLQSFDILTSGIKEFTNRCVKGIKPNKEILESYYEKNPSIGTVLNTVIGYDKTAELIKEALKNDRSVKELAIEKRLVSKKEADKLFDPRNLV